MWLLVLIGMNVLTRWCAWTHVPACTRLNTLHVWPEPSVLELPRARGPHHQHHGHFVTCRLFYQWAGRCKIWWSIKRPNPSSCQICWFSNFKIGACNRLSHQHVVAKFGSQWEKRPALLLSLWHLDISNAVEPIQSNLIQEAPKILYTKCGEARQHQELKFSS